MTASCVPVHKYLGMTIDFSKEGKVRFTMREYIKELLTECPNKLMKGTSSTSASEYLFNINKNSTKLTNEQAILYRHLVSKTLYL